MDDRSLIDRLIDTYHVLNTKVRTAPEELARARSGSGGSIEDTVRHMRDDELKFSQALRERATGVSMPDIFSESDTPVIGTETQNETTAVLVSQFGSAREVTLAVLRDIPEATWDQATESGTTIRSRVADLVAKDQQQLDRIAVLLGSPSPA